MKIDYLELLGSWRNVADAARTTTGMDRGDGEPSAKWKKQMLLSEHSPIRQLIFKWRWSDLKSWVSVHFVRHKIGIEHYVRSQRTDRTGVDRDQLPQSALVMHECIANAQSIINISKDRLCKKASPETRDAWLALLNEINAKVPELADVCVPKCVYRGFCPEFNSCNWCKIYDFQDIVNSYRDH